MLRLPGIQEARTLSSGPRCPTELSSVLPAWGREPLLLH